MKPRFDTARAKEKLRRARAKLKLSEQVVAKSIEVSITLFRSWESDESERLPTTRQLFRLAEIYGVSTDWLLHTSARRPLPGLARGYPPLGFSGDPAAPVRPAARHRLGVIACSIALATLLLGSGTAYVWWPGHDVVRTLRFGMALELLGAHAPDDRDRSVAARLVHNHLVIVGIPYLKSMADAGGELGEAAEAFLREIQMALSGGEVSADRAYVEVSTLTELRDVVEDHRKSFGDRSAALDLFGRSCVRAAQLLLQADASDVVDRRFLESLVQRIDSP